MKTLIDERGLITQEGKSRKEHTCGNSPGKSCIKTDQPSKFEDVGQSLQKSTGSPKHERPAGLCETDKIQRSEFERTTLFDAKTSKEVTLSRNSIEEVEDEKDISPETTAFGDETSARSKESEPIASISQVADDVRQDLLIWEDLLPQHVAKPLGEEGNQTNELDQSCEVFTRNVRSRSRSTFLKYLEENPELKDSRRMVNLICAVLFFALIFIYLQGVEHQFPKVQLRTQIHHSKPPETKAISSQQSSHTQPKLNRNKTVRKWIKKAKFMLQKKQFYRAKKKLKLWLKVAPSEPKLHLFYAMALSFQNPPQLSMAINHLEKAVKLDWSLANAHYQLSSLYLQAQKPMLARQALDTYISLLSGAKLSDRRNEPLETKHNIFRWRRHEK